MIRVNSPWLAKFHDANPSFDILSHDLLASDWDTSLNLQGYERGKLHANLLPHQRSLRLTRDPELSQILIDHKLDSAHAVASVPEETFVTAHAAKLPGGEKTAIKLHRKAVHIKMTAAHLFGRVRDIAASAAYRGLAGANPSSPIVEYYKRIPGYTDLFGEADYCPCEHCASLLGPAAYFVDLMRITDQWITQPNASTIKPGMKLEERRPDLFTLDLTCEYTNTVLPFLQIVNKILAITVAGSGANPDTAYLKLAQSAYPFNLPFILPLEELRLYLGSAQTSLEAVYTSLVSDGSNSGVSRAAVDRETLSLSIEDEKLITTSDASQASLERRYGYGQGQPGGLDDLKHAETFIHRTRLSEFAPIVGAPYEQTPGSDPGMSELRFLLYQRLDANELAAGVADTFFINATDEVDPHGNPLPAMAIVLDKTVPDQAFDKIENLTNPRLDRLDRFIRLANKTGWSFEALDWFMKSVGAIEIDDKLIANLASAFRLQQLTGSDPLLLSALWFDIKTSGRVSAAKPQDLFDRIFNNPALLQGRDPYTLGSKVPFDPKQPLNWVVADFTGSNADIRSRLLAALQVVADDLTTIAKVALYQTRKPNTPVGTSLDLNLDILTLLYRLSALPALTGLSVTDFLRLVGLMFYAKNRYDEPPPGGLAFSVATVSSMVETAAWLKSTAFSASDLQFILAAPGSTDEDPTNRIRTMINERAALGESARLTSSSFVFDAVSDDAAQEILSELQQAQPPFVSPIGLVLDAIGKVTDSSKRFEALAFLQPLTAESFVTHDITKVEAQQAFDLLLLPANGVLKPTAQVGTAVLTKPFVAGTSLQFLFKASPNADLQRAQVGVVLLQASNVVLHTDSVLAEASDRESQNAVSGVAQYLSGSEDLVEVLLPRVADIVGLPNVVATLLTPIGTGLLPAKVSDLLAAIARFHRLAKRLKLSPLQIGAVFSQPARFNIADIKNLTLADVRSLSALKELEKAFNDSDDSLIRCVFQIVDKDGCASDALTALSQLTGWPIDQINYLIPILFPSGLPQALTVFGLTRLREVFDLDGQIGSGAQFLIQLAGLSNLPILDANHVVIKANWDAYVAAALSALAALNGRKDNAAFTVLDPKLQSRLDEAKRNSLLGFAIWILHPTFTFISKPSDMYEFLLIDVEMSGCDSTSLMQQAIATVQLYMQRARMNLEQGVTKISIDPVWWQWMSAYRVWEVNRKIFLYPENYISPSTRRGATPLFDSLKEQLLQSDYTDPAIEDGYSAYFDDLSTLGSLRYVDGYNEAVTDPVTKERTTDLYLFARTNTAPFVYYYRIRRRGVRWLPWEEINQKIGEPFISPVFAFNRPFIFWVQNDQTESSTIKTADSSTLTVRRASVKFSFLRLTGQWSQPQTLSSNLVVGFLIDNAFDSYALLVNQELGGRLDSRSLSWFKPYAYHAPKESFISAVTPLERILITFGFALNFVAKQTLPPLTPPDKKTTPPTQYDFDYSGYSVIDRTNAVAKAAPTLINGYVQYGPSRVIDSNFVTAQNQIVLLDYFPGIDPQPYGPVLTRPANTLGIALTTNAIWSITYLDDPFEYPTAVPFPPAVGLLINIAGSQASVATIKNQLGWFVFDNGDDCFLVESQEPDLLTLSESLTVSSQQPPLPAEETYLRASAYVANNNPPPLTNIKFKFSRLGTQVVNALAGRIFVGLADLLTIQAQETPELPFNRFNPLPNVIPPESDRLDFRGAMGEYFQEVFFQIPFLIADALHSSQRFEAAARWLQYIFDPSAPPLDNPVHPNDRYWNYLPFREQGPDSLEDDLTDPAQIDAFNQDPFDPDAIARLRPTAYQKAVVLHYIDNLFDWGDFLFAQDTRESINEATNLYVMASSLLGQRPVAVADCKKPHTVNFNQIKAHYPAGIPEFLINLENSVPLRKGPNAVMFSSVPFNDVSSYFCIPENDELLARWDRLDDRLFKIRHCLNLQGMARSLALFAPPLDVRAIIAAASAGGGGLPIQLSAQTPVPSYRFEMMIGHAQSMAALVVQFGASLLAALEKQDSAQLELLRNSQEQVLLNLTTLVKTDQIDNARATGDALKESLATAQARYNYFDGLIKTGLSPQELQNLQSLRIANTFALMAGLTKTLSSIAHLIPNAGSPFAMTYGGVQVGSSLEALGSYFGLVSEQASFDANMAMIMAGYGRRDQEWQQNLTLADYEINQIKAQIAGNDIQVKIAERELAIHLKTIDQNSDMEQFLKSRFTSQQLYQWMSGRLSALYFELYSLTYSIALSAQQAFWFELDTTQQFVQFGYWDTLRKGLTAGEGLTLALGQMEKAFLDRNNRRLEIVRTVSLAQLDPLAMLSFRSSGECEFNLSEKLFDYDYPVQYARKIKSISISIPAVLSPYQNFKATLTQLSNQVVLKADASGVNAVNFLLGGKDATQPDATALRSNWCPNQQVAISTGLNDSGLFELNFNDERYLPFEGTGAVSRWRLSMPIATNRFDFSQVTDVIIEVRYTALDGGQTFRDGVTGLPALKPFRGSYLISAAQRYSHDWFAFLNDPPEKGLQTLRFEIPASALPSHLKPNATLDGFYLRLIVGAAENTDQTAFLASSLLPSTNDRMAVSKEWDVNYDFAEHHQTPPNMSKVIGPQTLSFEIDKTPGALKTDNGKKLDEKVLKNIFLILDYSGEVDW